MMHDLNLRPHSIEELVFHMPTAARVAGTAWARDFAKSIVQQARRRRWNPTAKQEALMRRMVSDMFEARASGDEDLTVIE
ncbi:hypothetical protein GEU84_000605 [Fertoebacter nigrum]|uniref:Uncharacterized protein n=1 Tax=Fertoeibacter niger TaxID=2656921 RepID=A0A8X8H4N2_9RHOB|nr:hypothetical protein [Fertoeibacter niger]NUB42871.1 hypothetical protein [Fertoeibacter niger]